MTKGQSINYKQKVTYEGEEMTLEEAMISMAEDGQSDSDMAELFGEDTGMSRNAAHGKLKRLFDSGALSVDPQRAIQTISLGGGYSYKPNRLQGFPGTLKHKAKGPGDDGPQF